MCACMRARKWRRVGLVVGVGGGGVIVGIVHGFVAQHGYGHKHSSSYNRATWGLPYNTTEMPSIRSPTQTTALLDGICETYLSVQQRCLQYSRRLKHQQLYTGYVRPTLQYNGDAINTVTDSKSPVAIDGLRETYLTIQQRCLQYSHRLKHSNSYRRDT